MHRFVDTVDRVLRNPVALLESIREGDDLRELPAQLTLITVMGFAAFGALLGLTDSALSAVVAAPKLVLVGLGTAAICLPALYVYGRQLGNEATALQTTCELLVALATTGLTLLALCPVWIVFSRYVNAPPNGYFHMMLGTVAFLAVAGLRGAWVLFRALRAQGRPVLHLAAWTVIFGMVGIQTAWTVRPFVGTPSDRSGELVLVRPLEKSAFDASATLIESNVRVLVDEAVER